MIGIVLRCSGTASDVRRFLASTHWQPCATYFEGESRGVTARVSTVSGFNLSLPDATDSSQSSWTRAVIRFLHAESKELQRLHAEGLQGTLDFGITLNHEAMATNFHFPEELISCLAAAHLELEVSCYPSTSD
jgi:hypothetical protein